MTPKLGLVAAALVVAGCNSYAPQVKIDTPTTAKPVAPVRPSQPTGSIWADAASGRTLFEDRRAALVGDVVLVQIDERQQASQNSSSQASRTGAAKATLPGASGLPFNLKFNPLKLDTSSSNTFQGKGQTASDNTFKGTITTTVVEVLANGNLRIAGEKQIGINRDVETIRLAGVINPTNLKPGNTVSSQQIADVRIDYRGSGYLDEAQGMGWMARFFSLVSPF